MPSPFAAALAAADRALDDHLGEMVQVTPMRKTDYGSVADPDRPAFDVRALVVANEPADAAIPKLHTHVTAEGWTVEIRRDLMAGRRVKKDDEILLLEQPGSPRVTVRRPLRSDPGRLIFDCTPTAED